MIKLDAAGTFGIALGTLGVVIASVIQAVNSRWSDRIAGRLNKRQDDVENRLEQMQILILTLSVVVLLGALTCLYYAYFVTGVNTVSDLI